GSPDSLGPSCGAGTAELRRPRSGPATRTREKPTPRRTCPWIAFPLLWSVLNTGPWTPTSRRLHGWLSSLMSHSFPSTFSSLQRGSYQGQIRDEPAGRQIGALTS
ncbi:mCG19080, isoform CRA_b, partial [Mus musculus]